jgi:hypothetical protein
MKKIHYFLCLASVCFFAACGTTTTFKPKESYSEFDNTRNVYVTPHGTISKGFLDMEPSLLGAFWTESAPDNIVLIVTLFSQWTGITEINMNIDGRIIELKNKTSLTHLEGGYENNADMMKKSTQGFVTDIDTVKAILASTRTWLRVYTLDGLVEHGIIDGEIDSKAFNALKDFMALVEARP